MPRRIPDFPDAFLGWNRVSSFGSIVSSVSVVVFLVLVGIAFSYGPVVRQADVWETPQFAVGTQQTTGSATGLD